MTPGKPFELVFCDTKMAVSQDERSVPEITTGRNYNGLKR